MAVTNVSTSGTFNDGSGGSGADALKVQWAKHSTPAPQAFGKVTYCAIRMVDGYVGQIAVDGNPVWESQPYDDVDDALDRARVRMEARLAAIFA